MLTGKKVKLTTTLRLNHPAVRVETNNQGSAPTMIPTGTEGTVLINLTSEILVEFYEKGAGQSNQIWIKREFFGQFLDTL
jgi:hypothetical protein